MLTVKHMDVTGTEVVYAADKVTYHPAVDHGNTGTAHYISIQTPKGETLALGSWGTFYIMNESGKTVTKYELGGWTTTKAPLPDDATTWSVGTRGPNVTVTRVS